MTSRGVLPTIKNPCFGRSLTLETLSLGCNWLSSLITRLTDVNLRAENRRVISKRVIFMQIRLLKVMNSGSLQSQLSSNT